MKKIILLLLLPSILWAQTGRFPKIGEVMQYSPGSYSKIETGCVLTFNKRINEFRCLETLISASIFADSLGSERGEEVELIVPEDGAPSKLEFLESPANFQYGRANFIMPSEKMNPEEIILSWDAEAGGNVEWELTWCTYNVAEAPCVPTGDNHIMAVDDSTGVRVDSSFDIEDADWKPDDGVVIDFKRLYNSDTLTESVFVESMRIEFTK